MIHQRNRLAALHILCIGGIPPASGQTHNFNATHPLPSPQMPFSHFMMMPMNYPYATSKPQKHNFIVIFKDGHSLSIYGKINADSVTQYLQWSDKMVGRNDSGGMQKIYPSETRSITRDDRNSPQYTGMAANTCWLFKAITGKISGYSPVADDELSESFLSYIQKRTDPCRK